MKLKQLVKAWLITFAVTLFVLSMGGDESPTLVAGVGLFLGLYL